MKNMKKRVAGSRDPTYIYHVEVLWYPENHLLYTHFVDKKPEAQSLKGLPQSKKPLNGRTSLCVFIFLVQAHALDTLYALERNIMYSGTQISCYKKIQGFILILLAVCSFQ